MSRQKEAALSDAIREALAREPGLILWRNSVGLFRANGGVRVWAGLPRGSADLVGLLAPAGRWLAIEVKRPGEIPTPEDIARIVAKLGPTGAAMWRARDFGPRWSGYIAAQLPESDRHVLEQEVWMMQVRACGGFACYADGVEMARAAVKRAREGANE